MAKAPKHHVRRRTQQPIDCSDHEAISKAVAQVNSAYDIDLMLEAFERAAATILASANLPATNDLFHCQKSQTPPWRRFDPNQKHEAPLRLRGLVELIDELGHDSESREGYAARMIKLASQIRAFRAQGRTDEALVLGVRLGELKMEAWMHGFWEKGKDFRAGKKPGARAKAIDDALAFHGRRASTRLIREYIYGQDPTLLEDLADHSFENQVSTRRKKLSS